MGHSKEDSLAAWIDGADLALAFVATDRRYTYASAAYARWLGRAPVDVVGRDVRDVHEVAGHRQVGRQLEQALGGERLTMEDDAACGSAPRFGRVECRPYHDAAGRVAGALAHVTETTPRDRALRELGDELQEVLFIAEASPPALVYVGPAYERLFGRSRDALEGRPGSLLELVHPRDVDKARELLGRARAERAAAELRVVRPDGEVRWVACRTAPLCEAGGCTCVAGILRDVTPLKEAARLRERFVHRLLVAQDGERRRIARELHDGPSQALAALAVELDELSRLHDLGQARSMAGELASVARGALDEIVRLTRGLQPRLLQDLGLGQAVAWQAGETARAHDLEVDVEVAGLDDAPVPQPVAAAMFRIVQEALTNAGKHAGARSVSVVVRRDGDRLRAVVEDDGLGFDARLPARGLGLCGIRERVKLLGGEVEIESVPGVGTSVAVCLPVNPEPPPSQEALAP